MILLLHITCSCIFMHVYLTFKIFLYIWTIWDFSKCFFLPPHSLVYVSASMAPKCKSAPSQNPLRSEASSSSDPTLLLFGSVMRMPERTSRRTFLNKVFIRNVESFFRTSPTLIYPLSFTVGVKSHCVTSWSPIHPCWSRNFTPTCMDSILQYLSFILAFEVRT